MAPFRQPRPWAVSLERWGKGIDNAHVDVLLGERLRERLREKVRMLILEDVRALGLGRHGPEQPFVIAETDVFRDSYLTVFDATLTRSQAEGSPDLLALFQVALLKSVLQGVARENLLLQDELKRTSYRDEVRRSGQSLKLHEGLVLLTREEHAINRRVLKVLFAQLRRLEGDRLEKLRASLAGKDWPVPEAAFYNPVLMVPDLPHVSELAQDYPVASWPRMVTPSGYFRRINALPRYSSSTCRFGLRSLRAARPRGGARR